MKVVIAPDSFKGTLSSTSGFLPGETDPIEIFLPQTEQNYSVSYVGEGKNSRYYVPLLKAYKDKDMKLVKELEKEMRQKEDEI